MRWSAGLVLALGACGLGLGPRIDFVDRKPLDPVPEAYAAWYADVEDCLGAAGRFGAVRWYVADDIRHKGTSAFALGTLPNTITIREDVLMAERVVRHESVHHILQRGDELHGTEVMDRCEREHW